MWYDPEPIHHGVCTLLCVRLQPHEGLFEIMDLVHDLNEHLVARLPRFFVARPNLWPERFTRYPSSQGWYAEWIVGRPVPADLRRHLEKYGGESALVEVGLAQAGTRLLLLDTTAHAATFETGAHPDGAPWLAAELARFLLDGCGWTIVRERFSALGGRTDGQCVVA